MFLQAVIQATTFAVLVVQVVKCSQCDSVKLVECMVRKSALDESELQQEAKKCLNDKGCPQRDDFKRRVPVSDDYFVPNKVSPNHEFAKLMFDVFNELPVRNRTCLKKKMESNFDTMAYECLAFTSIPETAFNRSTRPYPQLDDYGELFKNIKRDVVQKLMRCSSRFRGKEFNLNGALQCVKGIEKAENLGPRQRCLKELGCTETPDFGALMCKCSKHFTLRHETY